MTEQLADTAKRAWAAAKPKPYPNGGSFGKRDILPIAGMLVLCVITYILHDVLGVLPLPSEETFGFFSALFGLYLGRKLRR